jgi:Tfp pilus assembly PilM family ATPase
MPLSKLVNPRFPANAVGIESDSASVVLLERRRRDGFALRRAATIALPQGLVQPSFDDPNITNIREMADTLAELVSSAGLARQRKWSAALPEAATRTVILTLESAPASRSEMEEVLRWKIERGFGAPLEELRVARERLNVDAQGRPRYLAAAVRESVIAEYESVFAALGWRAGLILPRHVGEARWLALSNSGARGDALLVSSHAEGFTAMLVRGMQPLIVRSIMCDPEDRDDELYRLLLFYRDRLAPVDDASSSVAPGQTLEHLLVVGDGFGKEHVSEIINETLGVNLQALCPADVGLNLPSSDLSFDAIAAPSGLATLAWG